MEHAKSRGAALHMRRWYAAPTHSRLLTVTAVLECLTGLALVLAPGLTLAVLLGVKPDSVSLMLGPVAGIALTALGICCWEARTDTGSAARSGTLKGITVYNAGAGLLLLIFAASGRAMGMVVWIAALLHLGLAAEFLFSLLRLPHSPPQASR
jgi:hypothetical protein